MPAGVQYIALLRGINVGGKNLVKMADLRAAMQALGFDDVATYIASGNVLFRAPRQKRDELAARIESRLSGQFNTSLKAVLLTEAQLKGVVDGAPGGFGSKAHLCDVIFLRKPLTARKAFSVLELRPGIDRAWLGPGVVYYSRLASRASGSRISRVVAQPEYQNMTIRSWSSATKLLGRLEERATRGM